MRPPPLIVAHRGASGLVPRGNTLEAFEAAIRVGAPMAELDVRETQDGALIVHHDPTIGDQSIRRLDLAAVRRAGRQAGYPVATLHEVIACCTSRIALDVELKERDHEARVVTLLKASMPAGSWVVKSFHDDVVARCKELGARAGLLIGTDAPVLNLGAHLWDLFPERRLRRCLADFVSPHHQLLHAGFVRRMHAMDLDVWVWTVNDPRTVSRLLRLGVDAIITDRPDVALGMLRQPCPRQAAERA